MSLHNKRKLDNEIENEVNHKNNSNRTIDDAPKIPNIMKMSYEDRINYIKTFENPYGWPLEYLDIYKREKINCNPKGFDFTARIDGIKLFIGLDDQIPGKEQVKQMKNINCIKSRNNNIIDLDSISFNQIAINFLSESGIEYVNNFDEYFKKITKLNETYMRKKIELKNKYNILENNDNDDDDFYIKDKKLRLEYNNELSDLNSEFTDFIKPKYDEIFKRQPNKYQIIVHIIKKCLGEYAKYVCIAGGFSYSKYLYETYGQTPNFSDIDLFIHSCDEETANEIIPLLKSITKKEIFKNDNVFMSLFDSSKEFTEDEHLICFDGSCKSIQIIKRLYTCPAQVILGFDVDNCCILTTLDGETYATERCCYAIRNAYNVVNFDRMSPSYEFRIAKYNQRFMGIWIPFMEHFKENAVFDANKLDKTKMSSVLIASLIKKGNLGTYSKIIEDKKDLEFSDYSGKLGTMELYIGDFEDFKKLNPGEQIINTFHRIVLEDPIQWYPIRDKDVYDKISINDKNNKIYFEVKEELYISPVSAMNIIKTCKKYKKNSLRSLLSARLMIKYIDKLLPGSFISNNIVVCALNGNSGYFIDIYNNQIKTNEQKKFILYNITKYKILLTVRNTLINFIPEIINIDPLLLGIVEFSDMIPKLSKFNYKLKAEGISEEENFNRFLLFDNVTPASIFAFKSKSTGFYPSADLITLIDRIIQMPDFISKILKFKIESFIKLKTDDPIYLLKSKIKDIINYNYHNYSEFYSYFFSEDIKNEINIKYIKLIKIKKEEDLSDEESLQFFNDNLFISCKIIKEEKILDRLNLIYYWKLIIDGDINALRFYCFYYFFNIINSNINVDFESCENDNFIPDGTCTFYNNGKYYSTEYDLNLMKLGINDIQIENNSVIVLNSPAYEQYINC